MDREAWRAPVHGVAKNWTWLEWLKEYSHEVWIPERPLEGLMVQPTWGKGWWKGAKLISTLPLVLSWTTQGACLQSYRLFLRLTVSLRLASNALHCLLCILASFHLLLLTQLPFEAKCWRLDPSLQTQDRFQWRWGRADSPCAASADETLRGILMFGEESGHIQDQLLI